MNNSLMIVDTGSLFTLESWTNLLICFPVITMTIYQARIEYLRWNDKIADE